MSPRANSYDSIIDAAEAVVIESGASRMTLDAVASKAHISKGGLLHHFPTKLALLDAMVRRQIERRQKARKRILEELPVGPKRYVKGYVMSALNRDKGYDSLGAALFAAVVHEPKLTEPVREIVKKTYGEIGSSGMKFEKAAIVALAADALRLEEILSVSPFTEDQRKRIIDELLRIIDDD